MGAIAMPIPVTVEDEPEEEEYQPHGDDIAGRVVLFKQTELVLLNVCRRARNSLLLIHLSKT